ncbi:MAG: hypothetical protein ACHP65_10075 [Legionellales bacterium]
MNYISKPKWLIESLTLFFFMIFSVGVFAADIPEDNLGSQKYDKLKCIDDLTQNCINSVCINSDQRDCPDTCAKTAQQKCQQQSSE